MDRVRYGGFKESSKSTSEKCWKYLFLLLANNKRNKYNNISILQDLFTKIDLIIRLKIYELFLILLKHIQPLDLPPPYMVYLMDKKMQNWFTINFEVKQSMKKFELSRKSRFRRKKKRGGGETSPPPQVIELN